MNPVTASLYCPNPACQALNSENQNFCQQCRSPLPKRYLWVVGAGIEAAQPGELLGDRYWVKSQRVVLDTKPGLLPEMPTEISAAIAPYLRLFGEPLHIPQLYGHVETATGAYLLLLEQAPIDLHRLGAASGAIADPLYPALLDAWKTAPALRQLNWLWQIAHLWQPLSQEGVASSLLDLSLLRVEGPLVRLLELRFDSAGINLAQLGQLWSQWVPSAQPEIAQFFAALCQQLIRGQVRNAEQLVTYLDRALLVVGRSQSRLLQIATRSDQGPSRQRNEDACYPVSGTTFSVHPHPAEAQKTLAIVCDGIGGHEGGDVASHLAIETISQRLQTLLQEVILPQPPTLMVELENAVCIANDAICQRNDQERRLDRQRMGTTVVMTLVNNHEIYVTHIGDSRVYWINRTGCYQITVDDDVASREVRLGYTLYRDALQQPIAGSLVQALGMSNSNSLHPTVQRLILDEDGVFLLCSDGLSENDRVEEYWQTEILPLLEGKTDANSVAQRLVEIANTRNGHDNATVAVVHCQITEQAASGEVPVSLLEDANPEEPLARDTVNVGAIAPPSHAVNPAITTQKTQLIRPPRRSSSLPSLLLGILVLLGLGGVLAYLLLPSFSSQVDQWIGVTPQPEPTAAPPLRSPTPSPTVAVSPAALTTGTLVQVRSNPEATTPGELQSPFVALWSQPGYGTTAQGTPASPAIASQQVPAGGLLQVVSKQVNPTQGSWLRLKVCSLPSREPENTTTASPETSATPSVSESPAPEASPSSTPNSPGSPPSLQPGDSGWIEESVLLPLITTNPPVPPDQAGACTPATASEPAPSEETPGASTTPQTQN